MHVVITGASSGIGLALARHYLEAGAVVAAFARRAELLEQLSAQYPGRVHTSALDVRDAGALQQAAHAAIGRFGPPDVVIANAGVSHGTLTDDAADEEVFRDIMDINVLGMVKTFQPFLAGMREARTGTLVGIASVAGLRGLPGSGAYSASKAAAIVYLEALRVELRSSCVRVVTICPGYIRTPMTASNRFHMPFLIEADDAARRMARVTEQQRSFVVIPWQMAIVGKVLSWLPNWLYDPLFSRAPRKRRRTA